MITPPLIMSNAGLVYNSLGRQSIMEMRKDIERDLGIKVIEREI